MFSFQAKTQRFFLLSFCLGFLFPFSLSCLAAQSFWLFVTLWIVARQAPLSMGFSRQKYWSELPFSFPFLSPEGSALCLLHIYPHSLCSNQDWKDPHMNISNPNLLSEHHMPIFCFLYASTWKYYKYNTSKTFPNIYSFFKFPAMVTNSTTGT